MADIVWFWKRGYDVSAQDVAALRLLGLIKPWIGPSFGNRREWVPVDKPGTNVENRRVVAETLGTRDHD